MNAETLRGVMTPASLGVMTPTKAKKPTGPIASYLLARGWKYCDAPAGEVGECGVSNPDTGLGYCMNSGRWSKPYTGKSGWPQCAQHARQIEQMSERRGWK